VGAERRRSVTPQSGVTSWAAVARVGRESEAAVCPSPATSCATGWKAAGWSSSASGTGASSAVERRQQAPRDIALGRDGRAIATFKSRRRWFGRGRQPRDLLVDAFAGIATRGAARHITGRSSSTTGGAGLCLPLPPGFGGGSSR
jgi:hypothetical protein